MGRHSEILPDVKMERSHKIYVDGGSQDTSGMKSSNMETKNKQVLPIQTDKQKNRVRAFTGAFVVMISPVLLGIVLKKVNLAGAGKYEGIQMLEVFVNFVQGSFSHLAAATLQIGILPFLCVMITEVCASYIPPRLLLSASKVLVFVSNIFLMVLGCGILLLIHKKVWLVLSLCSIMVIGVIFMHIFLFRCHVNVEGTEDDKEYHSKLEGLLELSAGITVMMFLVLECVALEGLLRNSKGQAGCLSQPQAPAPALSEGGPTAEGQEEFLGATLIISFVTSAIGAFLMNVWTTPHVISTSVVLTTASLRGLNFSLQALPIALVVILITVDVLPQGWKYEVVWLPVFPPSLLFLVWLARLSLLPQQQTDQRQAGGGSATRSTSSNPGEQQPPKEPEDQKPAPLELTKVAFTGFLVVAVPSISNASVSTPSILFVLFTATAVLFGLLWRLLTHEAKPSETDLEAANYASFFAHTFVFLAGGAFWVMAANVPM